MYPNQSHQGQHPQQYESRQPNGGFGQSGQEYLPRQDFQEASNPSAQRPPHSMASMVTLPPQADMYRLPHSQDAYRAPPQDPYRAPAQHMTFNQPAPRQRTAIACRYCRRRKIRCSGFESSEDGRCTNCQRFTQECIFTPVSSQAQAFVPAHTAYPHLRNAPMGNRGRPMYAGQSPPVIYGAHGQPLNTVSPQGGYPPEQGYPHPGPNAGYRYGEDDRKREADDPHAATLPPPLPGSAGSSSLRVPTRRGSSGEFSQYHDPSQQPSSPASSTHSYHAAYPQGPPPHSTPHQTYYPESRRTPPQTSYSYDRGSNSPHGSTSTTSGNYSYPGLHPPQTLPAQQRGGSTPPPSGERRSGMSIQNMLDGGPGSNSGGRSATDHSMLDALMPRRGM
ncbi:MAG: hypothetical protein M1833_006224 [Piccolia ochrophora]|nr:MAG: hypothetical protein M1833_006224 [Piccolia ochrophora]